MSGLQFSKLYGHVKLNFLEPNGADNSSRCVSFNLDFSLADFICSCDRKTTLHNREFAMILRRSAGYSA